jgi:aspartate racemase
VARHVGIVACSAEGAALCYRTLCAEAPRFLGEYGHPPITMHTHPFSAYMAAIRAGDWPRVADLMLSSAFAVTRAGADFAICPDNTIHEAFDLVAGRSPIPWLHIARAVGDEAKQRGVSHVGILGTKYLMTGPVYPSILDRIGIRCTVPGEDDRLRIDDIIFRELVAGVCAESSRRYFNDVIARLKEEGCEAAVLGCTEIPLLVDPADCPLPVLDSTRLLARAALAYALEERR